MYLIFPPPVTNKKKKNNNNKTIVNFKRRELDIEIF